MTSYHKKISLKLTEHVYTNDDDNGEEYYEFRFDFENFGSATHYHTTLETPRYLHFSGLVDKETEKKKNKESYDKLFSYLKHYFTVNYISDWDGYMWNSFEGLDNDIRRSIWDADYACNVLDKEKKGPYIGYTKHVFTEYFFYPLQVFHMVDEDDPPKGFYYDY